MDTRPYGTGGFAHASTGAEPEAARLSAESRHEARGVGREARLTRSKRRGQSLQEYLRSQLVETAHRPDARTLTARVQGASRSTGSLLPSERSAVTASDAWHVALEGIGVVLATLDRRLTRLWSWLRAQNFSPAKLRAFPLVPVMAPVGRHQRLPPHAARGDERAAATEGGQGRGPGARAAIRGSAGKSTQPSWADISRSLRTRRVSRRLFVTAS